MQQLSTAAMPGLSRVCMFGSGSGRESTVKDGDYFGMPSIEAARLCAQAPTDRVLDLGAGPRRWRGVVDFIEVPVG